MINDLIKFANHLDNSGLHKEADEIDAIIVKEAFGLCLGPRDGCAKETHNIALGNKETIAALRNDLMFIKRRLAKLEGK